LHLAIPRCIRPLPLVYIFPHRLGARRPAMRCDRIRRGCRPEVLREAERIDVEEPHVALRIAMIDIGEKSLKEK
jgi:hypothetical protein